MPIPKGLAKCPECMGPAFEFTEDIHPGDPVISAVVKLLDGTQPEPGSTMKCDSCGAAIHLGKFWFLNSRRLNE